MERVRQFKLGLAICSGAGALVALLPLMLAAARLPEPMATHFGPSGAPDGALPRAWLGLMLAASSVLPAALSWPRRAGVAGRKLPQALGFVAFASALMAITGALMVGLNLDRPSWHDARHLPLTWLVPLLGVPLMLALAAFGLGRRLWPAAPGTADAKADAMPLASNERAYWSGSATNRWFIVLGLAIVGQSAVFGLMLSKAPPAAVHVLIGVHVLVIASLALMGSVRVSVNEQALEIRYGQLGWPRQRIALDRIRTAEPFELVPMDHGGWGYRGSLRLFGRAAVVVRAGPALRLELEGNKRFAVTVDDAETAARLINAFVSRRSAREA